MKEKTKIGEVALQNRNNV